MRLASRRCRCFYAVLYLYCVLRVFRPPLLFSLFLSSRMVSLIFFLYGDPLQPSATTVHLNPKVAVAMGNASLAALLLRRGARVCPAELRAWQLAFWRAHGRLLSLLLRRGQLLLAASVCVGVATAGWGEGGPKDVVGDKTGRGEMKEGEEGES